MNRSPLFYPLNRAMDVDAGGVADLQTDVMRFMAILSLCLVAIFALVQSIPLVESQITEQTPPPASIPEPAEQIVEPAEVIAEVPVPLPLPVSVEKPTVSSEPRQINVPASTASPVAEAAPEEGFTLRFATDRALTLLVGQNEIGLYAITMENVLRMSSHRDRPEFQDASLPRQYHEMDPATVPSSVQETLRRSGHDPDGSVKWGVTLTTAMTTELNRFLNEYRGGALTIDADGRIRMDQ